MCYIEHGIRYARHRHQKHDRNHLTYRLIADKIGYDPENDGAYLGDKKNLLHSAYLLGKFRGEEHGEHSGQTGYDSIDELNFHSVDMS